MPSAGSAAASTPSSPRPSPTSSSSSSTTAAVTAAALSATSTPPPTPRVRTFHKPNGGVSSARNMGLEKAVGEWISFVDSDDWLETDMIETLINKASETNADIIFSDFYYEFTDKREIGLFYDWTKTEIEGLKEFISHGMNFLWGSLHQKCLYVKNEIKNPEGINCCEDFHTIVRLLFSSCKISKVDKPLYHYRQHELSALHNPSPKAEADERLVYSDIILFFKEHDSYNEFKELMAWRTLRASQDLALDINTFDDFCEYNPDKKDYIWDCPYLCKKMKIITWLLSHGYKRVAKYIIGVRNFFRKKQVPSSTIYHQSKEN